MRSRIICLVAALLLSGTAYAGLVSTNPFLRAPIGTWHLNACPAGFTGTSNVSCSTADLVCRNDYPGIYIYSPYGSVQSTPGEGMRFTLECRYVLTGTLPNPTATASCPTGFTPTQNGPLDFQCDTPAIFCPPPAANQIVIPSAASAAGSTPVSVKFSYSCRYFNKPVFPPLKTIPKFGPPVPPENQIQPGQLQQQGGR